MSRPLQRDPTGVKQLSGISAKSIFVFKNAIFHHLNSRAQPTTTHILPFLLPLPANSATCPTHPFQTQSPYPPFPYTIEPSPGKGLGVFAAHPLERGSIIMREAPVITITPPKQSPDTDYSLPVISQLVHREYNHLSEAQKHEVLDLTYSVLPTDLQRHGSHLDILGLIFRNNAHNAGSKTGSFPTIARINHSCRPNAAHRWNEKLKRRSVYATRGIEAGEEIFVSFIPLLLPRGERRKKLARYGFTCTCPACSQHPAELHRSDQSRVDIEHALRALSAQMNLTAPTHASAVKRRARMRRRVWSWRIWWRGRGWWSTMRRRIGLRRSAMRGLGIGRRRLCGRMRGIRGSLWRMRRARGRWRCMS
ncbi:hypothetical protein PMIN06_006873 [Paraphaeosphaeria minitans]